MGTQVFNGARENEDIDSYPVSSRGVSKGLKAEIA